MLKDYKRKFLNSVLILISFGVIVGMVYFLYGFLSQSHKSDAYKIYEVSNETIANKSVYEVCALIEFELNDKQIGDVAMPWKCSIVNDTLERYDDPVFNLTTGLCNCSNILENGKPIDVQIRVVSNTSH